LKLAAEQMDIIRTYVESSLVDIDKLGAYLERHKTIKKDIFTSLSKIPKDRRFDEGFCTALDSEKSFRPITRETFIRRIPFFFYVKLREDNNHRSPMWAILPTGSKEEISDERLEEFYLALEFMFYDLCLSLDDIFSYVPSQLNTPAPKRVKEPRSNEKNKLLFSVDPLVEAIEAMEWAKKQLSPHDVFPQWVHYLRLCQELGQTDYLPRRFITAYNYALEASGKSPIIYHPTLEYGSTYWGNRNTFEFEGHFPCEVDGTPILRWTTLKVMHPKSVSFSADKSRYGKLTIVAGPKSLIYQRGIVYNDNDEAVFDPDDWEWDRIYAGPQNMYFDHTVLKEYREACNLTQKQLAEAIDVSVRTYQKWEAGSTMPDCHNLIRIMNWLGIDDVQSLITYDE